MSTPHLDRLAGRGRRFDAAYTQYPLAAASRMSLMTGWRPERTGVWGEPDGRVEGATPLQEHFHAAGYFTARVGPVFRGPGRRSTAGTPWTRHARASPRRRERRAF